MTAVADLSSIPGGDVLIEWFSGVPRFHDAKLLDFTISGTGRGSLRIHAWTMTDRVDAQGYFILENHVVVSLHLEEIKEIHCFDVDMLPAIIYELTMSRSKELIRIKWDSSYGVHGFITAYHVSISLTPGHPE